MSDKMIFIGSIFSGPVVVFYIVFISTGIVSHYPELIEERLQKPKVYVNTALAFGVLILGYVLAWYGVWSWKLFCNV